MLRRFGFALLVIGFFSLRLEAARPPAYNGISVDVPVDGGAMVSYHRTWMVTDFLDAGFVVSGGQINRKFDLQASDGQTFHAHTEALVLPLTGPFVTLHWNFIGISLGYDAFWAKTDLTVKDTPGGTLTGTTSGWGTVLYSPLLVLDFYDEKRGLIYGFGIGGYFGANYKDMTASSPSYSVTTNASPIDTITLHVRCLWADGRWNRAAKQNESL